MPREAPWRPLTTPTRPWLGPPIPSGSLVTLQLIGDVQTNWETERPNPGTNQMTTYDAIGRDIRDRLIDRPPTARFQMGDVSDGAAGQDVNLLKQRFALFDQWCGEYNVPMYKIMGNHDTPSNPVLFTPAQWAAYWGLPSPSYTVDLGAVRVIILGPTGPLLNVPGDPLGTNPSPVLPLSNANLAWLDARLTEDTRPTVILNHGSLSQEATNFNANRSWYALQATESGGSNAFDLLALLKEHTHVCAYMHGHTHHPFDEAPDNVTLLELGGRTIVGVDAGATYTHAQGVGKGLPVTFYATILDDGKTVEVRWRHHGQSLWASVPGVGSVHRLTSGTPVPITSYPTNYFDVY